MKLLKVNSISQLEELEYDLGSKITLPSRSLGVVELASIVRELLLDFNTNEYMLLAYNQTAMFVHMFNILTSTIEVKHSSNHCYVVSV